MYRSDRDMSSSNLSVSSGIVASASVVNLASLASTAPAALTTTKSSSTVKSSTNSTGTSNVSSSSSNPVISVQFHPPSQFLYLEENLSHCFAPLHKHHVSFLAHMGIERILNYSGRKLDALVLGACEAHGIHHIVSC